MIPMIPQQSQFSTVNDVASLAGLFNWQMTNASFTPDGSNTTTSFHVITGLQVPAESYIAGAVNTYDMISGFFTPNIDPNLQLFNTTLIGNRLDEEIVRKYTINRVPYANYDQPVDLGVGHQKLFFKIIFAGTQYLTAFQNLVQSLFGKSSGYTGFGTLVHPFYGKIKRVLPIRLANAYQYDKLNCVMCDVQFTTSDITHLSSGSLSTSTLSTISKYFIGTENAVTSIGGSISAAQAITHNLGAGL